VKFKYASDGEAEIKILIATCKSKKCVYTSCFRIPYVTTGPVYKRNWRNSVALYFPHALSDLGRLAKSDGQ